MIALLILLCCGYMPHFAPLFKKNMIYQLKWWVSIAMELCHQSAASVLPGSLPRDLIFQALQGVKLNAYVNTPPIGVSLNWWYPKWMAYKWMIKGYAHFRKPPNLLVIMGILSFSKEYCIWISNWEPAIGARYTVTNKEGVRSVQNRRESHSLHGLFQQVQGLFFGRTKTRTPCLLSLEPSLIDTKHWIRWLLDAYVFCWCLIPQLLVYISIAKG